MSVFRSPGRKIILFLASNPLSQARIRVDQEIREIDAGLRAGPHRDFYVLEQRHAVRSQDMRRAMLALHPQIVHFCGHGEGEEGLVLEGPAGESKTVSADVLARFFKLFESSVECVLLNACMTRVQAQAIAQHIPHVIGTPHLMPDRAAISFATGFYDALAAGSPVAHAYDIACSAAEMEHGLSGRKMPILIKGTVSAGVKTSFGVLGKMSRLELNRTLGFFKTAAAADAADEDAHQSVGLVYLQLGMYDLAIRHFRRAAEVAPDMADAYYYEALAMVRGENVKTLPLAVVRDVESLVQAAIQLDPRVAKYWCLLGLLKVGYYQANGLRVPSPSVAEINNALGGLRRDSWEIRRLLHSAPVSNAELLRWVEG